MQRTLFCLVLVLICLPMTAGAEVDYDTLIQNALEHRNGGRMAEAEVLLREAYRVADNKSEAAYLLALVLAFQEKYSDANRLLDRSLEQDPDNVDLKLTRARVLSYQGQFADASAITSEILTENPSNLDARNLDGRIYLYRNQLNRSRQRFMEVLESDPQNLEAMVGLYDSNLALGNREEAERQLDRAEQIAPNHSDVLTRRNRSTVTDVPRHELIVGGEASHFNKPFLAHWYDRFVEYRHHSANRNQQYVRLEHSHRFGRHDSLTEIGILLRDNALPLDLAFGMSGDAEFLPEQRWRIGTGFLASDGDENTGTTVARITYRGARYLTGTVHSLNVDFDYYYLKGNGWLSPGIGLVRDENNNLTLSWRIGTHHQLNSGLRVGADFTAAPETENNITTDTRVLHAYARYRLTNRGYARLDITRNLRDASYTRDSLAVTLGYRF